jgi:IS5 family transposase
MFRPDLESIDRKEHESAAGRKPTDRVRMFKMPGLQNLYGLSDDALEFQVTDRLTFMRFLGIDLGGAVPAQWTKNPAKRRQKDTDARRTRKNDEDHFGYKSHVSVDRKTKLVISEQASPANVHDRQVFDGLLGKARRRGRDIWADSAYRSREHERRLKRRGFRSHVHEHGGRGHPLAEVQQRRNRTTSQVRVRVEHGFATMTQMGGMFARSIGLSECVRGRR